MFGTLSPVSELEWASQSLEGLTSLSGDFTEKNKRGISNFSVQHLK